MKKQLFSSSMMFVLALFCLPLQAQESTGVLSPDPAPTIEGYTTKKYGDKTWMTQNLNWKGTEQNLGRYYDDSEEKGQIYGRMYTWDEAITGIPGCTPEQNPIKWGAEGVDDVGNPYVIDGTYDNAYNLQIRGVCPEGWHVANANDWYDLVVAVKEDFSIPANSLNDVKALREGYFIPAVWTRARGFTEGLNLTVWGCVGPYFKGDTTIVAGGLWKGSTTFTYNDYQDITIFPLKRHDIGFNALPGGRWDASLEEGTFTQEGEYAYFWSAYIKTDLNPYRYTIGYNNANFSNYGDDRRDYDYVRCVKNYSDNSGGEEPVNPDPDISAYSTKKYGNKEWMTENLRSKNPDGNLGRVYGDNVELEPIYGRLYTWDEALTGISNCSPENNPYKWGASGLDDMGNPYILDGTPANSYNIQIQGACPEGWHVPNANDWYDLLVDIKSDYSIPGTTLSDVANAMEGYIIGRSREAAVASITLTNWGFVGAYLKGSAPTSEGGLWNGGTTYTYTGNATFPNSSNYPLYLPERTIIGFNVLPGGQWKGSSYGDVGAYSFHWSTHLAGDNKPWRFTLASGNVNFSNAASTSNYAYSLRCVKNYSTNSSIDKTDLGSSEVTVVLNDNSMAVHNISSTVSLEVFDSTGRILYQAANVDASMQIPFVYKGVFIVKVKQNTGAISTHKIVSK